MFKINAHTKHCGSQYVKEYGRVLQFLENMSNIEVNMLKNFPKSKSHKENELAKKAKQDRNIQAQ